MKTYRADEIDNIKMVVGETIRFESLRREKIPPFDRVVPFLELPKGLSLVSKMPLDKEEKIWGSVFELKAKTALEGKIVNGFYDSQTLEDKLEKVIHITIE